MQCHRASNSKQTLPRSGLKQEGRECVQEPGESRCKKEATLKYWRPSVEGQLRREA